MQLPEGSRLADLIEILQRGVTWREAGTLAEAIAAGSVRILVNGRHARDSERWELRNGDAVALASPVGGG